MVGNTLLKAPPLMPTKLKRISVALDSEAYAKLEDLALTSKRSVSNMGAVLIEAALYPGGRVVAPREDRRGGRREGAGRKKNEDAEVESDD
jgi:CopG-like RHH_1 or ribbon-helix-helix domain, RHH_5